jgi:transmembrane sensor
VTDINRIQELYDRYTNAEATREELAEFFQLATDPANEPVFESLMSGSWEELHEKGEMLLALKNAPVRKMKRRLSFGWVAAAASVLILIFGGYFFFIRPSKQAEIPIAQKQSVSDVLPGSNKAILTLANGSTIILDNAHNGLLAKQSGSSVVKTDSGKLVYNASGEKHITTVVLNTLSTPRGGQFQLELPDGTKVWLNASSSITYPTSFSGKQRKVTITGEAYFEVVHNEKMPFRVQVGDQVVEDIGTAFNINAYPDESSVKTTLLQGSVKVTSSKGNQSLIIKPGEQTDLKEDHLSISKNVNTSEVIAWKDGSFDFESADLKTILRQFARWYDVDVEYQGAVSNRKFFAIVSRNTSLKKVLELLQDNNIKYVIEDKKLTIISN